MSLNGAMTFFSRTVVPFLMGGVVVMNLPAMVAVNPAYEPEAWRVGLATLLAFAVPVLWGDGIA